MGVVSQVEKANHAEVLAARYHGSQEYGNQPYTEHLTDVVNKTIWLLEENCLDFVINNPEECFKYVQVAFLHDSLEDTDLTEDSLREEGFGEDVIHSVKLVTKEEGYSYEEYLQRIQNDRMALVVKLADTIANLSFSMVNGNDRRIAKYQRQYNILSGAFFNQTFLS